MVRSYPLNGLHGPNDDRNRLYNVDVIGVLRGKYWAPAFAVKIGESAIRNCLRDQLKFLRDESLNYMGDHPLVFTEIGIPYDMDDKHAYKTGDYGSQTSAMDANHFALEGSTSNGFTLWVYETEVLFHSPWREFTYLTLSRTTINGVTDGTGKTCLSSRETIWSFRLERRSVQLTASLPSTLKATATEMNQTLAHTT